MTINTDTKIDDTDNDGDWAEVDTTKADVDKDTTETENFETDGIDDEDDVKVEAVVEEEEVEEVAAKDDLEELEGVKTRGAEKRIRQLVQQRNERDNALTKMGGELDSLRSELIKSQRNTKEYEVTSLSAREAELEERAKVAEKDYLTAFENGEQEKVLAAQNILTDVKTDIKIVKARKIQAEHAKQRDEILATKEYQEARGYEAAAQRDRQLQQEAPLQEPDELAVSWASDNDWFGNDEITTAVALAIDQKLKGEGFDPTTKEFYNEIDKRLQHELPHKFNTDRVTDNTNKPSQVVAGSSRKSSPKGSKVKLSKRDVQLAKKWDIPLDRYAAEKRKISKLDEGSYSTIETKRA